LRVVPVYVAFAIVAPLLGWLVVWVFRLEAAAARSTAFGASTRSSLVALALAVPGAVPVLPAIIVTNTLLELLKELVYVRVIATLGRDEPVASQTQWPRVRFGTGRYSRGRDQTPVSQRPTRLQKPARSLA